MNHTQLTPRKGIHTFTFDEGSGPPIVMLHGMVSTGDSWNYTVRALKDRHRMLAPDLPAHGRTRGGAMRFSITSCVDWLAGMLDDLDIPSTALIGQSMGGAIAAAFASRHPDRVSRLVLVDALGMSSKMPWRAVRNLTAASPMYMRASLTRRDDHLLRFFKPWAFLDPWGSPRDTIVRMAEINQPREIEVLWAGTRLLLADFLTPGKRAAFVDSLERITAPTLVAWGRHDGLLSLENAGEGIARIPGAALEIFEESAHEPMLEQPEEFNRVLCNFLEPWV